ncbi:hypothetical protein GGE35_001827 [Rhizobium cellulosilyticum]|uniref:Uncharacterized protein n=1 Tax=Aliirhizobium cellulosilyticum TaxID=393664 RepID=A0A7W6S6J6_9HYPH|nr:hypothetical protein [Rhizobium cellulosilyticum]MBB4411322.1 hypothetical protein [Rhizobium cellulosilyticum]MBB4446011.1 hypothetical protein [Rhizobium cellulosilyticum]
MGQQQGMRENKGFAWRLRGLAARRRLHRKLRSPCAENWLRMELDHVVSISGDKMLSRGLGVSPAAQDRLTRPHGRQIRSPGLKNEVVTQVIQRLSRTIYGDRISTAPCYHDGIFPSCTKVDLDNGEQCMILHGVDRICSKSKRRLSIAGVFQMLPDDKFTPDLEREQT